MGSIDNIDNDDKKCWVTLVTKPSYLPGVVVLAHTLDRFNSKYPLIVQYTPSLGEEAIAVLNAESRRTGRIIPEHVELLVPRKGQENTSSVAERFKDTFTKLRAFEVYKNGFSQACYLDADMAVFQNPDSIFDTALPDRQWLAANHICACNLDNDAWAPPTWTKGNCAYTTLTQPDQVVERITSDCRPTYRYLNGGMFMFYPTEELWYRMLASFNTSNKLKNYQFPDQEFLADFFWDKWQPVSWKFNALKTMRYWHPQMWSDEKVVVLHYIVDKPWERKVSSEGIAGHLGRDGETHQWWWELYNDWLRTQIQPDSALSITMSKLVGRHEPFTKKVPLPQEPGKLEDILPFIKN